METVSSTSALPQELISLNQWVVWRYEQVKDKPTKVPYQTNGYHAKSNDPATWTTFEAATAYVAAHPEYGIGFELGDGSLGLAGIDLDKTEDPATPPEVKEFHYKLIQHFKDTYVERTPSGTGYRILLGAHLAAGNPNRWAENQLEFYTRDRFFTVTGNGNNLPIVNKQSDIESFVASFPKKNDSVTTTVPDQVEVLTDGEILKKCAQAANGDKFKALWEGRWQDIEPKYPSNSEADLALCNMLALWTDNRAQARRLFLQSELGKRPKAKQNATRNVNTAFDQKLPPIDPVLAAHETEKLRQQIQVQKDADAENLYHDWTLPPGMVGQIAKFIYDAAYSPLKEVALAGAIAYYASLVGRAYSVSKMALNQYVVVLAKSGQGKEAAKSGTNKISKLLDEMVGENIKMSDRTGPEQIASAQGLLNRLSRTPCMMSILGEFGKLLQAIGHKHAQQNDINKLSAFLKLYNTEYIGTNAYADSDKNGQQIDRPAFSILGESTPSEFYKAVDEDSMKDGFLPRLTLIEYAGDSPEPNEKHEFAQPDPGLLLLLQSQVRQVVSDETLRKVTAVKFNPEADNYQKDLSARCRKLINEHNRNNEEHITEIWTRVHAKTIKLAALIAVGVDSVNPIISLAEIQWAENLVMVGTHKLIARFQSGDIGVSPVESKHYGILETVLQSYLNAPWTDKSEHNWSVSETAKRCGVIHSTYISKRLWRITEFRHARDTGFAINNIVKHFVVEGRLIKVEESDGLMRQTSKGGVRAGAMYRINNV